MAFSAEKPVAGKRIADLVERFPYYVEEFDRKPPFTDKQLQVHLDTIALRRKSETVDEALRGEGFATSLYETLRLWRIGRRKSKLVPLGMFRTALCCRLDELSKLEGARLDENLEVAAVTPQLWNLVARLGIVDNKNTAVAGTKCLHHLLPDLVPPMDREYTQVFFGWQNSEFQNHPKECFGFAFRMFAKIAEMTKPAKFVGDRWRSSVPKIIDNAMVAFCRVNGLESSNRKYQRSKKVREQALIKRAKQLGIYDEIRTEAKRRADEMALPE